MHYEQVGKSLAVFWNNRSIENFAVVVEGLIDMRQFYR
jgi:hypothetical protein